MRYTLQIATSKYSGNEIYQIVSGQYRSAWHTSVHSAWGTSGDTSPDKEGHHITSIIKFNSLDDLIESYPELLI